MNYKQELDNITKTIEERKTEKTRIETKLENLKIEKDKIINNLAEMGIKEDEIDNLKDIINDLEIAIEEEITEVKKILGK